MDRFRIGRPSAESTARDDDPGRAQGVESDAVRCAVPGVVRFAVLSTVLGFALGALWGARPVCAAEPDLSRTGSIDVALHAYASEEPVSGGRLELYRVADAVFSEGEGYLYTYTLQFAGCDGTLLTEEGLGLADTAEVFAAWTKEAAVPAERSASVDAQGQASFVDLSCGLYLIVQETAAEGYRAINPFLVTVPTLENGDWVYRVDATPKTSPVPKEEPEDETPPEGGTPPDQGTPADGTPSGNGTPSAGTGETPGSTTGSTGQVRTGDLLPIFGGTIAAGAAAAAILIALIRRRKRRV